MGIQGDRYGQAKFLLDVLQTRVNGYVVLLKSLQKTKQTGALDILLKDLPSNFLQCSEIDLNGKQFLLGNILDEARIQNLWETLELTERVNFVVDDLQNKKFKLVSHTIPPRVPYYIPRTLSKRLCLNKNIFTQNCPDVFVVNGMDRPMLTELVYGQKTAYSRDQLEEVTVRFIKLENIDHWKDIRDLSEAPVHLLNYCADENTLVLEETSEGSKILSYFLQRQNTDEKSSVTEDRFMASIKNETSVCICDLPGMGKPLFLASLAQHVIQNPKSFPVFIRLQHLIQYLKSENIWGTDCCVKFHLFKYIAHSVLGARILMKVVESYKLTAEIFFDEFDEIGRTDISYAKSLLGSINLEPNIRLYVTSRLHMRHELENALGVISYDILPFCEDNQIDYLTEYWSHKNSTVLNCNLVQFTKICLEEFKRNIAPNERDLAGIPLQCSIIAEVQSKFALIYSKTPNNSKPDVSRHIGKSMFDMYKKYIDIKIAKGDKTVRENDGVTLKKSQMSFSTTCIINETIINYHHDLALHVVFPEYAKTTEQQNPMNQGILIHDMLSFGLLEEVYNGRDFSIQFIHKTFAEYLVAEYVASNLTSKFQYNSKSSNSRNLYSCFTCSDTNWDLFMNFVLQTVFKTHRIQQNDISKRRSLCTFTYSTVMYFLDHHIRMLTTTYGPLPTQSISKYLNTTIIQDIFESCGYHNFGNIYSFVETICKSNLSKYKPVLTKKWFCCVISVFCEYSNRDLLDKCILFFNSLYSISLDVLYHSFTAKLYYYTPVEYACMRHSYDMLEYFLNKQCSAEGKQLLHICIENSVDLIPDKIQRTIVPMVKLLLNHSPNLIREPDTSNRTPLLIKRSSHDLIKLLILKGADFEQRDANGNTIAHLVGDWILPEDFHLLSIFLTECRSTTKIFKLKNNMGDTPLHCALQCIRALKTKTVQIILAIEEINVNETNKEEENLLISAVKGRQSVELLKVLIQLGADYTVRHNDMKWNLLHFAADTGNFDIFYYLLTFGINHRQKDKYGRTPFHIMNMHEVNSCYFIDRIVDKNVDLSNFDSDEMLQ